MAIATEVLFTTPDEPDDNLPVGRMSIFGTMLPPFIRFLEKFEMLDFDKALNRTRYNLIIQKQSKVNLEALMVLFIEFFCVSDIIHLR
jgi:hypothetical protein